MTLHCKLWNEITHFCHVFQKWYGGHSWMGDKSQRLIQSMKPDPTEFLTSPRLPFLTLKKQIPSLVLFVKQAVLTWNWPELTMLGFLLLAVLILIQKPSSTHSIQNLILYVQTRAITWRGHKCPYKALEIKFADMCAFGF